MRSPRFIAAPSRCARAARARCPGSCGVKVTSRSRGRGMSILRSTSTRPGRADITNTRSARNTASRRSWVTRHDGDLARRMQVADHAPQLLAGEGIERAERLVEHQQVRLVDQRAAERGALLHAAGQLPGILVALAARARPRPAGSRRARHIRRLWRRISAAVRLRRSRAAAAGFPASCARAAGSAPGTPCRRS